MLVYSQQDLDSLEDDLDFVNQLLEAGVESPMWQRGQGIRARGLLCIPKPLPLLLHLGSSSDTLTVVALVSSCGCADVWWSGLSFVSYMSCQ